MTARRRLSHGTSGENVRKAPDFRRSCLKHIELKFAAVQREKHARNKMLDRVHDSVEQERDPI